MGSNFQRNFESKFGNDMHLSLSPRRPSFTFARPGYMTAKPDPGKDVRLLLTAGHHGNEPCGVLAFNELCREGYFNWETTSTAGQESRHPSENIWPWRWDVLRVELANPQATEAGKRFLGANLNRLYTEESLESALRPDAAYEYNLIAPLMHAVRDCTEFLDIHSTSAPTPPMAFHMPGDAALAYAMTFPVEYTLEDETGGSRGTSVAYAAQVGVEKAILVECGQHDNPISVMVAKNVIKRFLEGTDVANVGRPMPLTIRDGAMVRQGFRWELQPVTAFQHIPYNTPVAWDSVEGHITCPFKEGAMLVMPTSLPVEGEEAWVWGLPKPYTLPSEPVV